MLRLFAYQSFWFFQIDAANDFNKYTLILNRTFEPTVFIKTPDPPPRDSQLTGCKGAEWLSCGPVRRHTPIALCRPSESNFFFSNRKETLGKGKEFFDRTEKDSAG